MRTTISIDDNVLETARRLAAARHQTLGRVVSELMLRGLQQPNTKVSSDNGFPVFQVAEDSPLITLEDVKRDDDGAE